ncbi:MAG: glycerol-3-phosphate dehydrogenase [Granulosicoccus sp.]|nr:glycerol-3-phosphate dehydrogenase [Granulosicoccus sp.]
MDNGTEKFTDSRSKSDTPVDIENPLDVLVIGGGINGVGVARDAAGRGLSVLLCEKDDLAQHTSSASTKLIHGGLRYLEHYDFKLVRHALQEREVLLRAAPHIIWPLRFVLPHHKKLRPRWLIRIGLFLYDHIGGRKLLPSSHSVNLQTHVAGQALKPEFSSGFEYSDCWVQDSRLVVLNAMDAADRGAEVLTHTECIDLTRHDDLWSVRLRDHRSGTETVRQARTVVNAAGPWVEKILHLDESHDAEHGVRLVKGSHIVVNKLFDHDYVYIFQNADNRVLFAVPYEKDFTLLGTTDVEILDDPGTTQIDQEEIAYICRSASEYFRKEITTDQVAWTYSGVRPLYDDSASSASKVTRDYKLHLDDAAGAPILSVYGGKITTYRKLAEEVVEMLQPGLAKKTGGNRASLAGDWTSSAPLPGGDIPNADFDGFLQASRQLWPWLEDELLIDYARNYGTRMSVLLGEADSMEGLGQNFGGSLYQREIEYLVEHEWASSADDILWRRSKKGLHMHESTHDRVTLFLEQSFTYQGGHALKRVS